MKVLKRFMITLIIVGASIIFVICSGMALYLSTDICQAAKNGELNKIRFLLAINPRLVNHTDRMGSNPLHLAVTWGHERVAKLLLAKGAQVDRRLLHSASAHGRKDLVELLIANGTDVNVRDGFDATPLHIAAMDGHTEVVELLLYKGACVNAQDNSGRTPLQYARDSTHPNSYPIIEVLRKYGALE